jgi:predicted DNA-binding transcriptional regulator AlpA
MRDYDARDLDEHLARTANSVGLTLEGLSEKLRDQALTRLRYGFTEVGEPEPPEAVARAKERAEASRLVLQTEWHNLGDVASTGRIETRGKPIGQDEEVQLTAADLRNCRFLSWLGLAASTLEKARLSGNSPRFLKLGRVVRYRVQDLDEWLEKHVVTSTSAYPGRRS